MPQLPVFTAKLGDAPLSGGRRASAPEAPAAFGKAVIKAGDDYLTDVESEESRKALVASSEIRAKYARALDAAATDGSDTAKLKENMHDELSKVGDNFQTRRGTQSLQLYTSNTDLMFDEQANKIRVTRAAANARLEGSKFLSSASAIIQSNPSYLAHAEGDAAAFVSTLKDISPEHKAEIEQGLKKELNMAAAISAARIDPNGTRKKLEAGEWDLTPEQRQTAVNKADTEFRAARAEDSYIRAENERQLTEADGLARDKQFAAIMGGTATRRAIMDDANLKPQTREHLIALMEHRAKELKTQEKASDPVVKRDLWLAIHAAEGDPAKIYDGTAIFNAVHSGKLNTTDANQLNALVANQRDENNRSFGTRLGGRMQVVIGAMRTSPEYQAQPELAAAIQLELMSRVEKKAAEMRSGSGGEKPRSPDSLLDPESKDFFFKPGTLKAVADDVKAQKAALLPKVPDLRKEPDSWKAIEVGALFVDPKGTQRTMTKELKTALGKQAGTLTPATLPAPGSALEQGVP